MARDYPICQSRREFLESVGCLGGALAALGLPADALGAPVTFAEGVQSGIDRSYPIPSVDGVTIDKVAQVIIARANAHVYALALSCPHQNAAVKWVPQHNQFECTKHDSHYQPDGIHTSGRATRHMDRFPIRREGGTLSVDTGHVFKSDTDAAGWAAASLSL
jgi:nitrite reductase/ring-hydroxylating ferredoxin subunit